MRIGSLGCIAAVVAGAALGASAESASDAPRIGAVSAFADEIRFTLLGPEGVDCAILELEPYEAADADRTFPVVWNGLTERTVAIARFDGARDRIYRKFQLMSAAYGDLLGEPQYVTDLDGIGARDFEIPWPESKKGVTCIVDVDDAVELGIKYGDEGVLLNVLIDWRNPNPEHTWDVDGHPVPINMDYVRQMDEKYRRLTEAGVNFTPIPVVTLPREREPDNPLIHPDTDVENAPMHHGAFNVVTEEGLRCYRAAMEFMADRYTRPDGKYGLISGLVIGNELQSHWVWHNQGETPQEEVIRDYVIALRMADLAARKAHRDLRIYVSMEHHWTKRGHMNDPLKEIPGDQFLDGVADWSRREGDFPWHVAFHPYPESLFEPRFWNDRTAVHRFDTPRITFKNLEVLPAFLRQERFLYQGRPRRIALTEQGFHTPDGPDGERIQAAAYVYAYHKVKHMPEIDAFILHRHVDARDEGGLKLGLWTTHPDSVSGFDPGRKKFIWDVFRLADTDQWEEAFAFALPIIGIASWDEALPNYEIDMTPAPEIDADELVYDLCARISEAETRNTLSFQPDVVIKAAGWAAPSIFQHPPEEGAGEATWVVDLPEVADDTALVLRFETMLLADSVNGVRYTVLVDGEEVFRTEQREEPPVAHAVDLTAHAGGTIRLTLCTDAMGDTGYDWSHWVQPLILREPRDAASSAK